MVLPWAGGSSSDKLKEGETAGTMTTKRCTKQLHPAICDFEHQNLDIVFFGGEGGRYYFQFSGLKETLSTLEFNQYRLK